MSGTQINVVVNQDYLSSVLDLDKEIRAAMRQTDLEGRQQKKQIEEKTATTTTATQATNTGGNTLQDPPSIFKKQRKQDLAASRQNNGERGPTFGHFGKMITKIGAVSVENDNLGYYGWFGNSFKIKEGKDFALKFIGFWDREGNGANRTHYMALRGGTDNIYHQWTLQPGEFRYREDGFVYAKLDELVELSGGDTYVLAIYYFASDFADRYEYYVGNSAYEVGEATTSIFANCNNTENSQDTIFPMNLEPAVYGDGDYNIIALNINIASYGYFS